VLGALRYFYEQLPDLHVIAAGSLLDFTLQEFEHSMPVGRIEYFFLHPLSFTEFLDATGAQKVGDHLRDLDLQKLSVLSTSVHTTLLQKLREYYFVGGMPAVVEQYAADKNLRSVQRLQSSIVLTLQDDFYKYRSRFDPAILKSAFLSAAIHPARRKKYVEVSREYRSEQVKKAFHLLHLARLVEPITYSSARGIPLSTHAKPDFFKPLFLDIGLCNRIAEVPLVESSEQMITVQEGELADQFVGQQLLCAEEGYIPPHLFYWERLERGASAEVDYVMSYDQTIIPIEVKAGRGTTLRSLHYIVDERENVAVGVRFSTREYETETLSGKKRTFRLLSFPLYCAELLPLLLAGLRERSRLGFWC